MDKTRSYNEDEGSIAYGDSILSSGDYDNSDETVMIRDTIAKVSINGLTRSEVMNRLKHLEVSHNKNKEKIAAIHNTVEQITKHESDLVELKKFWNNVLDKFPKVE